MMTIKLGDTLGILAKHGIRCSVSLRELLIYLRAPSYEEDSIKLDDILSNELLLLHEIAEICLLKRMGYTISSYITIEAYLNTYHAPLRGPQYRTSRGWKTR